MNTIEIVTPINTRGDVGTYFVTLAIDQIISASLRALEDGSKIDIHMTNSDANLTITNPDRKLVNRTYSELVEALNEGKSTTVDMHCLAAEIKENT